jgi:GTP-binding protein EngB required for normal cell division
MDRANRQIRIRKKKVKIFLKLFSLYKVFLLVDSRYDLFESDEGKVNNFKKEFLKLLNARGVPAQIILTKIDKISHETLCQRMDNIYDKLDNYRSTYPLILPTSSNENIGIDEFRAQVLTCSGLLELYFHLKSKEEKKEYFRTKENMEKQRQFEIFLGEKRRSFKFNKKKKKF